METIEIDGSTTAPFYALRYDRRGRSEGPLTERKLVEDLETGDYTDVYLFSHGWNNDWPTALERYHGFMATYKALRDRHDLDFGGRDYRPLLAGVFWPSTALILPWEDQGPEFAGAGDDTTAVDVDRSLVTHLADDIADTDLARFYELVEQDTLDEDGGLELAAILANVLPDGDPDVEADPGRSAEDLVAAWAMIEASVAKPAVSGGFTTFGSAGAGPSAGPEAAGFLSRLDPRNLVRTATVWKMKDRAGVVGSGGVRATLAAILEAVAQQGTRVHLIGHSYGARLLMAALVGQSRRVRSLLMLQPAVNHLCFADQLPNGKPGGFKDVLSLVERPIMTTFSSHDRPLHDLFHLALRRGKDVGEIEIAADEPPNQYAALGGYGPRGFADWDEVGIKDATDAYDLGPAAPRVWAIRGDRRIDGHGSVVNEATAWALYNLAES